MSWSQQTSLELVLSQHGPIAQAVVFLSQHLVGCGALIWRMSVNLTAFFSWPELAFGGAILAKEKFYS